MSIPLSSLGQRVRFARLNAGFTSQEALAKKIGVSQQSLARIELDRVHKPRILPDIAMATGYSTAWLASGQSQLHDSTHASSTENTFILELTDLPIYLDPTQRDTFKPKHYLTIPISVKPGYLLVRVDGDSMVSIYGHDCSFKEGTIIIVDTQREAKNGNYVISQYDHMQPPIFKKYREDAGYKYLMPLNPLYESIRVDNNDAYKILAVVVAHLTTEL